MQGMSGISFAAAAQPGAITSGDPVERGLRKQISELKKQLGELSSDVSLAAEEKVRRQQELRKQITELENQIRQHQMEQRMEKQKEKTERVTSSEQAGMEAVISVDSTVKNARVQESAAAKAGGRAKVIKSELKLDGGRGSGAISSKLKELARAEQTAEDAKAAQLQDLGKANQKIQSVAKAEEDSQKTENVKESETKEENQAEMLVYSSDGKPVWEEKESQMLRRA